MEPNPNAWGAEPRMNAWEAFMWRTDGDLRTRTSGMLVEILDSPPDWERLVAGHERAIEAVPRLRQRVVEGLLPLGTPEWSSDPHFDLSWHLDRIRLPEPGTTEQLLELAARIAARPTDVHRPPWQATLVEGLAGGGAAYVLKVHHSLADGLGLIQLLEMAHSTGPGPGKQRLPSVPSESAARESSPARLTGDQLRHHLLGAPRELAGVVGGALRTLGQVARDPLGSARRVRDYGSSLQRVLNPASAPPSPLLRGRGCRYRYVVHEVPLADLKNAGRAAGGSVNDAFLAAVLGAFRFYHEHFGRPIDAISMAIPISLRNRDDSPGGNRFAGARLNGPVGEPDPAARVTLVREMTLSARDEPAIAATDLFTPFLNRLPVVALAEVASHMFATIDIQASNFPAMDYPVYLAGARVSRLYPMTARPGVAAWTAMVSYDAACCIAVNLDPDVINAEVVQTCLRAGFDEVLTLAG